MPSILMQRPEDDRDRQHYVRFGFGAGVDRKLHAAFEARFGFPLIEARPRPRLGRRMYSRYGQPAWCGP